MSYCQKKKRQKLRGREFRLITATEGMTPVGMSLKLKLSSNAVKTSHFWNTGVFTTLKHLIRFTWTGQGGRCMRELTCYFGRNNGTLVSFDSVAWKLASVCLELRPTSGYFLSNSVGNRYIHSTNTTDLRNKRQMTKKTKKKRISSQVSSNAVHSECVKHAVSTQDTDSAVHFSFFLVFLFQLNSH